MFKPAEPAEPVSGDPTINGIAQESWHDASGCHEPPGATERRDRSDNCFGFDVALLPVNKDNS